MGNLYWAALIAVLIAAAAAVIVLRRGKRREPSSVERIEPGGRVSILETTPVDATRNLVLIRCDNVEHLVMIGGPGDVVVENDVRKVRAGAQQAALGPSPSLAPPAGLTPAHAPPATPARAASEDNARRPSDGPKAEPPVATVAPAKIPTAQSPQASIPPRVEPPARSAVQSRPALAAVPAPATPALGNKQPPAGAATPDASAGPRPGGRPGQGVAPAQPPARREPAVKPAQAPAPGAKPAEVARANVERRRARELAASARETAKRSALPAAQTPWPEGDSIENEIVQALRSDVHAPSTASRPATARPEASGAKSAKDSATTLGDLAERLEEALAREVQQSNRARGRLDLGLDAFVTETGPVAVPSPERTPAPARERIRPDRILSAAPEAEARGQAREQRSPHERQDEAPVINLNARRRDAADPLEDEMARLLGELTSDTSRR